MQLTEEAVVATGWDKTKTFLLFNNGMKAYYKNGDGTSAWTFGMKIEDSEKWRETPLLKAISLSHDSKVPADSDTSVIQDYAGNLLIQPANFEGVHEDGDKSNVNSKIDWAKLMIDNTKPLIGYRYEAEGATDAVYRRNGKVTIDANDPPLIIPPLDPSNDRGQERPSKGIFRPSNMTGGAAPSVGLVFYYWSKDPADPFAAKSADNFAAVKRYSLAGKQPGEELYPGEAFSHINLKVANNKTNMIAPPAEALTADGSGVWYLHTWTADMTWDTARQLEQYKKSKAFIERYPDKYKEWKAQAPAGEDPVKYADDQALKEVGNYEKWELDFFKRADSNWTYNIGTIKLDNRAPAVTIDVNNATGNDSDAVYVPVKVVDEHSGVRAGSASGKSQLEYQWTSKGASPQDIDWKTVEFSGDTLTISTKDDIVEDGKYDLHIKAADQAGNEAVTKSSSPVEVNSANRVSFKLTDANQSYVQAHEIELRLKGLGLAPTVAGAAYGRTVTGATYGGAVTNSVYGGAVTRSVYGLSAPVPQSYLASVEYGFTGSVARPQDRDYTALELKRTDAATGELVYIIPADKKRNGEQYVHVRVTETDGRQHYNSKAYKFDNEPPTVTFSKDRVEYALTEQKVTVTITDLKKELVNNEEPVPVKQYQWVPVGSPDPDVGSPKWLPLPANGEASIDNKELKEGETVDYRLFVKAVDLAGNVALSKTAGFFRVYKAIGADTPPVDAEAGLIYLYGDPQDGYTAILKLKLDIADKTGYEYSVSVDNGASWTKWRPYTNFVSLKVPTNKVSDLRIQAKYRANKKIGQPVALDTSNGNVTAEPVYALATVSPSGPVKQGTRIEIDIAAPLGIKVVPSGVNPSVPARVGSGNSFVVTSNGTYSFDLTDTADIARKAVLQIVVNNVDNIKPQATVNYNFDAKTNGSVIAQLDDFSEPVAIKGDGKAVHTFTENGTHDFVIADEAGNETTLKAEVKNIDKTAPEVVIKPSYGYGENSSQSFKTIKNADGTVLKASGVTLTVEKAKPNSKNFHVLGTKDYFITMQENGIASFTVYDDYGNTAVVKYEVNHIVSIPPVVEHMQYEFVDENGQALPEDRIVDIDGKKYAKGQMKVTVSGKTEAPNEVFYGTAPSETLKNRISENGMFKHSRTYSANGSTLLSLSDLLGNVRRVPVHIEGLDNTAPQIKLHSDAVNIVRNKPDFDPYKDLGGYDVSDNVSKPDKIKVSVSGLDLTQLGRQQVVYAAVDEVGNTATAKQDVFVVSDDGMLIMANDVLISGSSAETALFDRNTLSFRISKHNLMDVNGQTVVNEQGTYDVYYYSGLYREGQMKYIADRLTYEELAGQQFAVKFDKVGWYTIIVRNQEREREYATFFIGNVE